MPSSALQHIHAHKSHRMSDLRPPSCTPRASRYSAASSLSRPFSSASTCKVDSAQRGWDRCIRSTNRCCNSNRGSERRPPCPAPSQAETHIEEFSTQAPGWRADTRLRSACVALAEQGPAAQQGEPQDSRWAHRTCADTTTTPLPSSAAFACNCCTASKGRVPNRLVGQPAVPGCGTSGCSAQSFCNSRTVQQPQTHPCNTQANACTARLPPASGRQRAPLRMRLPSTAQRCTARGVAGATDLHILVLLGSSKVILRHVGSIHHGLGGQQAQPLDCNTIRWQTHRPGGQQIGGQAPVPWAQTALSQHACCMHAAC